MNLAFLGCAALAKHDGIVPLPQDAIWERKIAGGHWVIKFNGTKETRKAGDADLRPYSVYVEWCGWPAGIIDPAGGIIATGAMANEDTFIAAIEAELGCSIEAAFAKADPRPRP